MSITPRCDSATLAETQSHEHFFFDTSEFITQCLTDFDHYRRELPQQCLDTHVANRLRVEGEI